MIRRLMVFLVIFGLVFVFSSCQKKDPYLIGFSGPLTGKYSDLGVQGRNGAMLAIEEINAAGGVNGREIRFKALDDMHDPEIAIKSDLSLIKEGAVAIIGHMTSAMSVAALPEVQKAGGILVAPTTATSILESRKDHFFRTMPDVASPAIGLAQFVSKFLHAKKILIIRDNDNRAYVDSVESAFIGEIKRINSTEVLSHSYSGKRLKNWSEEFKILKDYDPDFVFCICSAKDLSGLARTMVVNQSLYKVLAAPWAYTKEITQMGGNAVNGILFSAFYSDDSKSESHLKFKKNYRMRFGFESNFASVFSYEAVQVVVEGLKKQQSNGKHLKEILPGIKVKGVLGDFQLNEFGDVNRPTYLVKIEDRKFVTVKEIKLNGT